MTVLTDEVRIKQISKRSGEVVGFDPNKIENAIKKALRQTDEANESRATEVADSVTKSLNSLEVMLGSDWIPSVEFIQDEVENRLMLAGLTKTAKAYILYRAQQAELRNRAQVVPESIRSVISESAGYFDSAYQQFIFYQFYARWVDELGRRETWVETIDRFMNYMTGKLGDKLTDDEYSEVREAILHREVCPSMRLLWASGDACDATNVAAYNCAYIAPTSWKDLSEIMYVSMCGAGCGFAVEEANVSKFPVIKKQRGKTKPMIVIEDSKEGWCDAFAQACKIWANGYDVGIDYSQLRDAGARLVTMGGRSSGPKPLRDLMVFTKSKILAHQGRKLSSLDLHDIICQIGQIVVAGGVRRSALISLSELSDVALRDAKHGEFWLSQPQRAMANNSAIYEAKPTTAQFLDELNALVQSGSGERGIFNRGSLKNQIPARRWASLKHQKQVGVNPCGEIYLRSKQFCNLTSIVIRPDDTVESLHRKMRVATLIGTYQATLTDFKFLSREWHDNCEEEQLLGVSMTGYYDNELVRNDEVLEGLRDYAVEVNAEYADRFGKNRSTAITCVKPHGNSGQLLGVGSGMHPWFAQYYIRRVRISANDPLLRLAREQGVPIYPEVGFTSETATTLVLEFPVKAPDGAITADMVPALEMLEEWKRIKIHFTEHNPSVTIYVGDDEWLKVANFVYENWDFVGGLSFLPRTDTVYQLAPYEKIDREEYLRRVEELGELDFSKLVLYETSDQTTGAKELACVGGACEI